MKRFYTYSLILLGVVGFAGIGYARITNPESLNTFFTGNSLTSGSIIFTDGTNLVQDNSNLYFDDTNNRLGVGSSTPSKELSIGNRDASSTVATGQLQFQGQDSAGVLWCVVLGPDGAFSPTAGACQ